MTIKKYLAIKFQSSLPHGSDAIAEADYNLFEISILAPSRERPAARNSSDGIYNDFNPRSLTGATRAQTYARSAGPISILAPSRERQS